MRRIGTNFPVAIYGANRSSQGVTLSDGKFAVIYADTGALWAKFVDTTGIISPGSDFNPLPPADGSGIDIDPGQVSASDDPYGSVAAVYTTGDMKIGIAAITENGNWLRGGV